MDGRSVQPCFGNGKQGSFVLTDAAARAAQGVGRADDHGIADFPSGALGAVQGFGDSGRHAGLTDRLHGIAELFPVLRFFDGHYGRAQQPHTEFIQRSVPA